MISFTHDPFQNEGVLSQESATTLRASYKGHLNSELTQADSYEPQVSMLQNQWTGLVWPASDQAERNPNTGIDTETLRRVGKASVHYGEGFVSLTRETRIHGPHYKL